MIGRRIHSTPERKRFFGNSGSQGIDEDGVPGRQYKSIIDGQDQRRSDGEPFYKLVDIEKKGFDEAYGQRRTVRPNQFEELYYVRRNKGGYVDKLYNCDPNTTCTYCQAVLLYKGNKKVYVRYIFSMDMFDEHEKIEELIDKELSSWIEGWVLPQNCTSSDVKNVK